jgi:hypothetical protein
MSTLHGPVPVQAPFQPSNVELSFGVAVSRTLIRSLNSLEHGLEMQLMPVGLEVTMPEPLPKTLTDKDFFNSVQLAMMMVKASKPVVLRMFIASPVLNQQNTTDLQRLSGPSDNLRDNVF